jgi:hypothetical protein
MSDHPPSRRPPVSPGAGRAADQRRAAGEHLDLDLDDLDDLDGLDAPDEGQRAALAALLAEPGVWDDPDPSVEDRVLAAIAAEAPARPVADARADGPPAPAAGRRRRFPVAIVASAAAVVVALVVGAALLRSPAAGGREVALQPTPLVPAGAPASINIETRADGVRILLDPGGLPPAAPGTYYEAWLRKSPQVGVSAGTFHLRGGGAETIELWAGVLPEDYPLFTVTVQQEGGGAESSGRVVLSGRVG